MGIVKIARGETAVKNGGDDDRTLEDRMLLQSFPSDESHDCQHADVDCELAMSRGQMCNVPYGLYDLPELSEVLSLETWNLCLTEDDRLCLAAYLPDMDQRDFFTTMKELFSGDAMFFGSPLRSFFLQLQGGLYSPEVSQARELMMMFQRRRHYHFLKLYHDRMVRKFTSMDKLLRSSTSASLGEKVPIPLIRGYERCSPCVGVSSSTLPTIAKVEDTTYLPSKRPKLMDGTLKTKGSTRHSETAYVAKSLELNLSDSQIFKPPNEPKKNCSKLPKGVLKIRTGGKEGLGLQSSSFCTPPYAFVHDVHGFSENSSSGINIIRGTSGSSQWSPLQWKATLETYPLIGKFSPDICMTVPEELKAVYPSAMLRGFYLPAASHGLAYPSEARESPTAKNLLKNFGLGNSIVSESSPDSYARVSDGYQMNGYTTMHSLRNAESVSDMLNLGTRIYPPHRNSEQLEATPKYQDGMKLEPAPAKSVTRVEEARQFAYTYARRKPHKNSPLVEDTVSPSVLASMANLKAKAIKL